MNKKKPTRRLILERKLLRAISPAVQKMCEPPKLTGIKRALFIQPHPDDNQIGAGGTIAWLIDQGTEVWELTVLDDRFVDLTYSGEGPTVRQKEAMAAQSCLGMKNAGFLGFGDRRRPARGKYPKKLLR
jgi:LmbE family N-acetylglucosaminyl deacetylase